MENLIALLVAAPGVLAYARVEHTIANNTTADKRPAPLDGEVVLETEPGALRGRTLAPHSGAITMGLPGS